MKYLISPTQLQAIRQEESLVIIDVRSDLQNPDKGKLQYEQSHIPGAYYLHLMYDLSGEVGKHGGNHPLPDLASFAKKLASFGIDQKTKIVVYGAKAKDMYAGRAWWLIRHVGAENVSVLSGGYEAWKKAGYEVDNKIPQLKEGEFTLDVRENETVSMEEVKHRDRAQTVLIDSRSFKRYTGEVEPLYEKAGHMPGASNFYWEDLFVEDSWKSIEALRERFASLPKEKEIIVSCGSGVSACPNILALHALGYQKVKLYPGSYSDWISYPENEVETKVETNE